MKKHRELDGQCPNCFEYTTAGDSCCGQGAIVEGSLITDDDVWDAENEEDVTLH